MLALFYESKYGQSALNTNAINDARRYFSLAESLQRTNDMLRARVSRLELIGGFETANEPMFSVV